MSDPRLTPDPAVEKGGERRSVAVPVADLCRHPNGPRDRQLLFGHTVVAGPAVDGWHAIQADKDGYCGHVQASDLIADRPATHRVTARSSQCYAKPDMKSRDRFWLSHGSEVVGLKSTGTFMETPDGFVPLQHLGALPDLETDPARIAERYLGTPYLWGGNSALGIDCSGLVQAACLACGIPCPGDSDMQETTLGTALPADAPLQRNDLLFWKGHVALVTDPQTLIHANAHSMSVWYEPLDTALDRIASQGDGPVTSRRRLR